MTHSSESNDRDRSLDRQLRVFDRRLTRLEETQLTGKEINGGFDRVYEEIDALEAQINARFDRLEHEARETRSELNGKIDVIMRYLARLSGDSDNPNA
jgi:septation ring formation regulator EzrA